MSLQEKTFYRSLKYSLWHRKLPSFCKAWNIDFVEVRNGKIVAFMEISETNYPLDKVDLKFKKGHYWLLSKLSQMTNIPSFIIFHNSELSKFKIYDLVNKKCSTMTEEEYKKWLCNL